MMQRRDFLQAAALSSGLFPTLPAFSGASPRIGVIGAGIIGASIAAHLAEGGAEVLVFEKDEPASGASRASLAWINPSTVDTHYRDLRLESMAEWRRFEERLKLDVVWGGSISWSDNEEKAKNLLKREEVLRTTRADPKHVTEADIKAMCPYLMPGETKAGFFLPQDGHIDPVATTLKILTYAVSKGARVLHPCPVDQIVMDQGRVKGVQTTKGDFQLDLLVSACGIDTSTMLEKVGVKIGINAVPGLKIHTHSIAPTTRMVYDFSSALEWKQMPNGEAVAIYVGGPPKLPVHEPVYAGTLRRHPTQELADSHGESLKSKVAKYWPALKEAKVKEVIVGYRPMPLDGLPMIGHVPSVPGMYMVATHSGVTLAPIIGRFAAQEILSTARLSMLSRYRPERFL